MKKHRAKTHMILVTVIIVWSLVTGIFASFTCALMFDARFGTTLARELVQSTPLVFDHWLVAAGWIVTSAVGSMFAGAAWLFSKGSRITQKMSREGSQAHETHI